jgi:phage baseplate assembly protein W
MPIATYYAVTRAMTETGDVSFAGATWTRGQPLVERVRRCLRTRRGSYLPDPTFGVDTSVLQKATPNVARVWTDAVRAALERFARRGELADLSVRVEARGDRLFYEVSFVDVRARERATVRETI